MFVHKFLQVNFSYELILYVNLILDVFPALALGVGEGSSEVLKQDPRDSNEPVLMNKHWLLISLYGILISISILSALYLAINVMNLSLEKSVTVSFLTLAFARLGHVFNMRDRDSSIIRNEITKNKFVWGAIALSTSLILAAVYLPGLSEVLNVVNPGINGWFIVIIMSLFPFIVGQIVLLFSNKIDINFKNIKKVLVSTFKFLFVFNFK